MNLALVLALALSAGEKPALYAVVVGHNGGASALSPLRYADDDAVRLARWFDALGAQVQLLTRVDENTQAIHQAAELSLPPALAPTRTNVFDAFEKLRRTLSKRPSGQLAHVVIFYAGHGLNGRLLLEPEHGAEAGITGRELRGQAMALGADQVVLFVDACRAQSLFVERGNAPQFAQEIEQLEAQRESFGALVAAQVDKPAGETPSLMGGFFSHVLASGLAGGADVNSDGQIAFGELAGFVAFHTQRLTGQQPWFIAPPAGLTATVVHLRDAPTLRLDAQTEGRLSVRAPAGLPIFAEVNKAKGQPMKLALPAGTYSVIHRLDAAHDRSAIVVLAAGAETQVPEFHAEQTKPGPAERGDLLFDDRSFQTPFSSEVLATLEVGYASRNSTSTRRARVLAVDAAYLISPAPFGWPGVAQGLELGLRWYLPHLLVGIALFGDVASVEKENVRAWVQRLGLGAQLGYRFDVGSVLAFTPWGLVGLSPHFVQTPVRNSAAPLVPLAAVGLRGEGFVAPTWSLFLEARVSVPWVNFEGTLIPLVEPSASAGVCLWL